MATNDTRKPTDPSPADKKSRPDKPTTADRDELVDLGDLPPGGDSAIPLATLPEPPSGQSLTTWTEVIRRQRAAKQAAKTGEPLQMDAASDKDLLNRLVEAEGRGEAPSGVGGGKRLGDTSEISESKLPLFSPQPKSESEIDLGPTPQNGPATGGSEVRFDILYPPSDAGGAMPLPASDMPPSSGVNFFPAVAIPAKSDIPEDDSVPFASLVEPGLSSVELGGSGYLGPADAGRSSILDVLLREPDASDSAAGMNQTSDIMDYGDSAPGRPAKPTHPGAGAKKPPTHPGTGPSLPPQPDTGPSAATHFGTARSPATQFGAGPSPVTHFGTGPSPATHAGTPLPNLDALKDVGSLDLSGPASGFESAESIDLYAHPAAPPSITDSGTLEISDKAIEESQKREEQLESSAVDLNPQPSFVGSKFDVTVAPATDGGVHRSDSDIDLELPEIDDGVSSSIIQPRVLATEEDKLAAQVEARRKRPAVTRVAERAPRPMPARRSPAPVRLDQQPSWTSRHKQLLLGAGIGVFVGMSVMLVGGAMSGGKGAKSTGPDQTAALEQMRKDLHAARQAEADAKFAADRSSQAVRKALTDGGVASTDPAQGVAKLAADKRAADTRVTELTNAANRTQGELNNLRTAAANAKKAEDAAVKNLTDAEKAAITAKKDLLDATKALNDARKEVADAKKAADDRVALVAADAATKEKDARLKLEDAAKREAELAKAVDAAKKSADDAARARETTEALVKAVEDRLAKAKFVGDKPDGAALVRGLDDAIKAATSDATNTLRSELVKAREQESKLKTDLVAAREREAEATKTASAAKANEQKVTTDAARLKSDNEKLNREAADAIAKAATAEKVALQEKAEADRLTAELSRQKAENDRLARDIETIRELAELIKNPGSPITGPLPKQEPTKIAGRFFDDGLRAYFAGQYPEAESSFRKAIQFQADDARYHYLLGLALWMVKDTKAAELEFEKGRDLELAGRPSSRAVSAVLERIQGPSRQAVNVYRP